MVKKSKRDSATCILKQLHWLPVKQRIEFKILLITFKALQGTAPSYLQCLLQQYVPSRSLRSESANLLIVPKTHRKLGTQSFAYAAPTLWNQLPADLRKKNSLSTFKTALKTHLFKQALT